MVIEHRQIHRRKVEYRLHGLGSEGIGSLMCIVSNQRWGKVLEIESKGITVKHWECTYATASHLKMAKLKRKWLKW